MPKKLSVHSTSRSRKNAHTDYEIWNIRLFWFVCVQIQFHLFDFGFLRHFRIREDSFEESMPLVIAADFWWVPWRRVWWRRGFHPFWSTSRRGKNPVAETVGFFRISMAGDTNAFIWVEYRRGCWMVLAIQEFTLRQGTKLWVNYVNFRILMLKLPNSGSGFSCITNCDICTASYSSIRIYYIIVHQHA